MTFCIYCGVPVDNLAAFCTKCGKALTPRPAAAARSVAAPIGGAAAAPTGGSSVNRFATHAEGGPLLGIYVVNFLLSVVTLGIYWFWGRTKVRRYLAETTEFAGERFAYHGTGGELLRGWLKALGVLILLVAQLFIWQLVVGAGVGTIIGAVILYLTVFALIPLSMVGIWRYRLTRTSYRGIRFSFRGTAGKLAGTYYGGLVLTAITLGLYYPFFVNNLQRYIISNSSFGDRDFGYDGDGKDLFGSWVIALLLAIPTLTLSTLWFAVKQGNYSFQHTTFGAARFKSDFEFGSFLGLVFTNYLLIIFTLFIGFPWAVVRGLRYVFSHLTLEGALQLETVRQRTMAASATGEGIADVLDVGGSDLGIGV